MDKDKDKKQKFLFDNNRFDLEIKVEDEIPPEETFTETEVEEFKKVSFQNGRLEGQKQSREAQEEVLIGLMSHIENLLKDYIGQEVQRYIDKNNAIIRLSLKMVQKLFPSLDKKNSIDDIQHVVEDVLSKRQEEPRLVITVHDSIIDKLQERIDTITTNTGFQGKIILMSGDMSPSDCRIEWADGGAERNFEQIFLAIENALSKQLAD